MGCGCNPFGGGSSGGGAPGGSLLLTQAASGLVVYDSSITLIEAFAGSAGDFAYQGGAAFSLPDNSVPEVKCVLAGLYAIICMAVFTSDPTPRLMAIAPAVNGDLVGQGANAAYAGGTLPIPAPANTQNYVHANRVVQLAANDIVSLVACDSDGGLSDFGLSAMRVQLIGLSA